MIDNKLEQILYNLSKKSDGRSQKLFEFFGVSEEDVEVIFPVTKLQRDIIIDLLLDPAAQTYNICMYFEVSYKIDVDIWRNITEDYIKNNTMMRTKFLIKESLFYQAVHKKNILNFTYLDASKDNFSSENVFQFLSGENRKLYDITNDTLYRSYLIKISDDRFCVGLMGHQVSFDGYSAILIMQDWLNKYESTIVNNTFDFPERTPFKDYVFFNNENFDSDIILDFWKNKSMGVKPLHFNAIRKDSEIQRINQTEKIGLEELKKIKKYCWNKKITVPIFFKSVYCLLLKYYFQTEDDFVVYENFNNRGKEFGDSIGEYLYVQPNIIPEEVLKINSNLDFLYDYLKDHRKETRNNNISMSSFTEFNKNQKIIPFFNYFIIPDLVFLGQNIQTCFFDNSGKNELYFYIRERNDHLELFYFYANNNFTDHNFLKRFCSLVNQIVSQEKTDFLSLEYILDSEKKQIEKINSNKKTLNTELFPALFENQVYKTPDKIALQYKDKSLSYKYLNEIANCLAENILDKCKIQKQEIVGVFMDRSDLLLISFLGILKSGAVYVPIDKKYPISRISYIILETGMTAIITDKESIDILPPLKINTILIESIMESAGNVNYTASKSIMPYDAAYIIFTSGSTGKPKGAIIEHIGMINHIYSKINDLDLDERCIIAQNASQGFDISIWQFLTALVIGGKTIIYDDETIFDTSEFIKKTNNDCVSILEVVPSYLKVVLEQIESGDNKKLFQNLQYLLVTGETVHRKIIQKWFSYFADVKVVNAYGPTEASDDITHFIMHSAPDQEIVPIGKPVQNMNIYIVDEGGRLCPPGIRGEICVAGVGVGRGYLNDVFKTDMSFKEDSFFENKDNRLYKTGDLGTYTDDGMILFFGRKDYQVKIRGHRIELGEIEIQLMRINGINKAIVVDIDGLNGEKYLGAYITLDNGSNLQAEEVRSNLKNVLPEYMIPVFIEILENFPLTSNQKIDRKALSVPVNINSINNETIYIPLLNDLEKRIAEIWSEVLNIDVDKIGRKHDFFLLGGHSLMAIKAIQKIKEIIPGVGINHIFLYPTIEQLSEMYSGALEQTNKIQNFDEMEKRLKSLFDVNSCFIKYKLPDKSIIALFINKPEIVMDKSFLSHIENEFDDIHQPNYILNDKFIPVLKNGETEIEMDEKDFFRLIKNANLSF